MRGLSGICSLFIRRKNTSFSVLHNTRISHLVNRFARGKSLSDLPAQKYTLLQSYLWYLSDPIDIDQIGSRLVQEMKIQFEDFMPLSAGQSKCAAKLGWAWPNDLDSRTLPL